MPHVGEDFLAFGMEGEREGGQWRVSAGDQDEWFANIEEGAA